MTQERGVTTALLAIYAACFLIALDRAVFAPLLPAMASDLSATVAAVGLAVSFYSIPYGIFQIFYGPIGDRRGKLQVIRWAILFFAVGTGLCGTVAALPMLYALRTTTGIFAAGVIPLSLAFIGDVVPYERRQQSITTLLGIASLGTALSTAVGGIIGQFLSWRALFFLYSVIAFGVAAMLFRVRVKTPTQTGGSWRDALSGYLQLARIREARSLYAICIVEGAIIQGAFTYVGAFVRDRFELDYLVIGLVLACYALGTVAASRVVRRLAGRSREENLMLGGGLAIGASYGVLLLVDDWYWMPVLLFTIGAGFAFLHSTLQTRATELVPALRGTAVAMFAFSLFLGGGIGTAIFGMLITTVSYEAAFVVAGAVMTGLAIVVRSIWQSKPA